MEPAPQRYLYGQRAALIVFGAALLLTYAHFVKFTPDGITGGILDGARNLAQGRGLVTHSINTAFLPYYKDLTLPLPYLWYPLVPWVTSWFFVLLGPHAWCVLILPVACYFASALLLHELGRRLSGAAAGLVAASLLLCQPFMIETSVRENFTDPVLVCLIIASTLAVVIAREPATRRPAHWLALAGALLGLGQYARSAATMLYIPMVFLVMAASGRPRGSRLGVFLGACVLVQVPLFWWNAVHIGSLTFTPAYVFLFMTKTFPGLRSFALVVPTALSEIVQRWGGEIAQKWLGQVWVHYKYFFTATNPVLLVGAVMTFTTALTEPQRLIRNFTAVLYLTLVVFNSLAYWDNRYLLPVVPFVALLGVEFLRRMLTAAPQHGPAKSLLVALVAVLLAAEGLDFVYQCSKAKSVQQFLFDVNEERTRFIKDNVRAADIVLVMDPGLVAWESGSTAVELPIDLETAMTIHDRYVPFNTMILDAQRPRSDLFGHSEDWYRVAGGQQTYPNFYAEKSTTLSTGQVVVLLRERRPH